MAETKLMDLATRCEQATGPDRELDEALAQATGWQLLEMSNFDTGRMWHEWKRPKGVKLPLGTLAEPPFYTASLDAAMTLVPEGMAWSVDSGGPTYPASAEIGSPPTGGELFNAQFSADGETPALALCAAALRAAINPEAGG